MTCCATACPSPTRPRPRSSPPRRSSSACSIASKCPEPRPRAPERPVLPKELIRRIRKLEIRTRKVVSDMLAGQYHSVFKGRGMAFSEVRPYQPGDEIRTIDWNVTARMNDPYVKVFTEERELTVVLLVDVSASKEFGSRDQTKSEIAAEVAAQIAFSAIANNDRVGLILFSDRVEHVIPPKKGRKHVLRVVSDILSFEPQGHGTNLSAGLT